MYIKRKSQISFYSVYLTLVISNLHHLFRMIGDPLLNLDQISTVKLANDTYFGAQLPQSTRFSSPILMMAKDYRRQFWFFEKPKPSIVRSNFFIPSFARRNKKTWISGECVCFSHAVYTVSNFLILICTSSPHVFVVANFRMKTRVKNLNMSIATMKIKFSFAQTMD